MTVDEAVVHIRGDGQGQFSTGTGQRRAQRLGVQHPEEQVDIVADQPMVIAVHGPEAGGHAYL